MIINIPQHEADYLIDNMRYSMFIVDSRNKFMGNQEVPKELFGFRSHFSGREIYFHREVDLKNYVESYKSFYIGEEDVMTYTTTKYTPGNDYKPSELVVFDSYSLGEISIEGEVLDY